MPFYDRKTPRLRIGRISSVGANYFTTLCTKHRAPLLTQEGTSTRIIETLLSMHEAEDIRLICATVMPDHAHLLLRLGERLELGQVIGKFKTKTRAQGRVAWHWQEDAFEHRVREDERIEDYAFYIFMNPYRADLCPLTACWPWWLCPIPDNLRFPSLLNPAEAGPGEWLGLCDKVATKITIGDE